MNIPLLLQISLLLFCFLVSSGRPAFAALISYWAMNENTGTTVADSVSAHNGTFAGPTSPVWATGHPGQGSGLTFPDTPDLDARVEVSNHADFSPSANLSIGGWVILPDATPTNAATMVSKVTTAGGTQWQLLVRTNGTFRCGVNSNSTVVNATSTGTLTNATWTHLACTWGSNTLRIYKDGVEDGTGTATTGTMSDNTAGVVLGNTGFTSGRGPTAGTLDEVWFYNTTLSAAEVLAIVTGGVSTKRRPLFFSWQQHWLPTFLLGRKVPYAVR